MFRAIMLSHAPIVLGGGESPFAPVSPISA
jgi:hypothetical protein